MKFVGIVGANYDQSYNRKLLEFIRIHFKIKFQLEVLEIDEVPMFNQDEKWDCWCFLLRPRNFTCLSAFA